MIAIGLIAWFIVLIIFAFVENPVGMFSLLGIVILITIVCYIRACYKERKRRKELGDPLEVAKAQLLEFRREEIEAWEKKWGRKHPLRE